LSQTVLLLYKTVPWTCQ